jgi:hypothetical protein
LALAALRLARSTAHYEFAVCFASRLLTSGNALVVLLRSVEQLGCVHDLGRTVHAHKGFGLSLQGWRPRARRPTPAARVQVAMTLERLQGRLTGVRCSECLKRCGARTQSAVAQFRQALLRLAQFCLCACLVGHFGLGFGQPSVANDTCEFVCGFAHLD